MNNKEIKDNKNNNFSKIFIIVLILHIILLYVLPGLKEVVIEKPKLTRITFGENNATVDVAPKKQPTPPTPKEKPKEQVVKEPTPPKVEEKPEPIEKPKEIAKVAPKKVTPKPKPVEKKVEPKVVEAPPLVATQSIDDLDLLATTDTNVTRTIPVVSDKKVEKIKVEDDAVVSPTLPKDVKLNEAVTDANDQNTPTLDEVGDPTTPMPLDTKTDKIAISSNDEDIDNVKFDDLMSEDNPTVVGPKSGLKVGSEDGKSRVEWSPSNKDPEYPLEAEKNAQTADVKIILEVDSSGKVIKVMPVKTGVEVIDKAVEKVAYTWNIKLISNGLTVGGRVEVEYKFKLKGRE